MSFFFKYNMYVSKRVEGEMHSSLSSRLVQTTWAELLVRKVRFLMNSRRKFLFQFDFTQSQPVRSSKTGVSMLTMPSKVDKCTSVSITL